MLKNDIAAAIDAQRDEQSDDLGLQRHALSDLPQEDEFATIVTGVRRCGKSTLLAQWAKHGGKQTLSVLFDDLRLLDFTSDDFTLLGKIILERKATSVILDEIQDIDGWERFVAGLLASQASGGRSDLFSRRQGTRMRLRAI